MKTEEGISRQNSTGPNILMECELFRNDLKHDDTCLQFHSHDGETKSLSKSRCDGSENESSEEDTNDEGKNTRDGNSDETIESTDGCVVRETSEEEVYVDCRRRVVAKDLEDEGTHYAEILTTKPCSSNVSMSRRTRESNNPVLRLHYDQDILIPDKDDDEDARRCGITQSRDDSSLYENTESRHVSHPKVYCSRSDSEITYANVGRKFNQDNSHLYENSSRNEEQGKTTTVSNETSDTESLYEDISDVYEVMSSGYTSNPISIVYTSVDFPSKNTPPSSIDSSSFSSSIGSLERSELSRCSSCSSTVYPSTSRRGRNNPPELPQRKSDSLRARPSSVHFGGDNRHDLTEFGMYTGTLVGSCSVMKNSPKSVQHIIADFLAREKKERSKPVSLEVNNEFLRLSLNCAPWNLLAQNTVDDIGCVTTVSANNKTALGYTISKPGEDTRCYVIHCSDVDAIKEAILSTFKRPDPSLSRWSSMSVIGSQRSGKSRSLPRMKSTSRHNDLAIFDELVYLGSYKVKKSYLVVNDNITAVLDHTDSKHYTFAKIELYKDAIHLKDGEKDRILDIHQLEWILSMGLFDEDRRYFGYISSKAYQGSKTRTFCHVFRCTRVGIASRILESIRQACQATFLANSPDDRAFRSRLNSNTSSSSEESMSSSSETMSVGSTSSSPPDFDGKVDVPARMRRRPRLLERKMRMSAIRSFAKGDKPSDILEEEKEEVEVRPKATVHRFNVFYLISTIVSPPLKPKHVKNCLKQYQKSVDKEMKRSPGNSHHYKKVQLVINQNGITIVDDLSKTPQAFFERASLSSVQAHPEGKCAFAFSTMVSGNTKHKCHLFLQDKEYIGEIIKVIQSQIL